MATATKKKPAAKPAAKQSPKAKPAPAPAKKPAKVKLPVVVEAEEAEVESPAKHKALAKLFAYNHVDADGNVTKPVSRNMMIWRVVLQFIHDSGPCTIEKLILTIEGKYGKCEGRINQIVKTETGVDSEGNPYRHNKRIKLVKGKLSWVDGVSMPGRRGTAE